MNLKTYQAYSMAEALAAVKRDLGADAVILNTRSYKRGGVLGLGRRTIVELTATTAEHAAANKNRGRPAGAQSTRTRRPAASRAGVHAYASSRTPNETSTPMVPSAKAGERDGEPNGGDFERTRRLAEAMLEAHRRRDQDVAAPVTSGDVAPIGSETTTSTADVVEISRAANALARQTPVPPLRPPVNAPPRDREPATSPATSHSPGPVAQRFILTPPQTITSAPPSENPALHVVSAPVAEVLSTPGAVEPPSQAPVVRPAAATPVEAAERGPARLFPEATRAEVTSNAVLNDASSSMQDELSAIRTMVGEVLQRQVKTTGRHTPTMPQALFDLYLQMIGQELSDELADQIINDVRDELTAIDLDDEVCVRAAVRDRLMEHIPVAAEAVPSRSPDGRPLTIALVGPTGVGKTTTLAKLAASFKLRHRRRVGLITADTYRIAAVDQLRTYANIIGLPLQVVLTPSEMRQAVHTLSECDVILIDTAGRSQNDEGRIDELKTLIEAADPHEVHLILSSTASEKVLLQEADAFAEVGIDKVAMTKLDEAVSFGVLVNVVRKIGKELSFFTTGQEVPDHLEVSQPNRLASLVLGEPFAS